MTWTSPPETTLSPRAIPPPKSTRHTKSSSNVDDLFPRTGHLGADIISHDLNVEVEFDLWFVHGLMGNSTKTWTHENGTFWPSLLANDFPQARLITYGYDADVVKFAKRWQNASSEGLQGYGQSLAFAIRNSRQGDKAIPATRPIYFIGHSLGGLVIEQALLICIGPDKSLHDIAAAAAGIIFMGTPHEGSHLARWGRTLAKLVPEQIRSTNTKILTALDRESDMCKYLEESFQAEAKHGKFRSIKLFCFYETIVMPGFSKLIVPEHSATLRADFKCAIHGTHKSMARFPDANDEGYLKVKGQLASWVWLSPTSISAAVEPAEKKRAKRKKRERTSIHVVGPQFETVQGATVHAHQYVTKGDLHIQHGANSLQTGLYGTRRADVTDDGPG